MLLIISLILLPGTNFLLRLRNGLAVLPACSELHRCSAPADEAPRAREVRCRGAASFDEVKATDNRQQATSNIYIYMYIYPYLYIYTNIYNVYICVYIYMYM